MNLAVMQPYLFPHLGYYQLVHSVDKFVFYDDVAFIKHGYINRNSILVSGKSQRFTIPVPGMSSNKLIKDLSFDTNNKKFFKTIKQSYSKAPYFSEVYKIIERVLNNPDRSVEIVASSSIRKVFEYLELDKDYFFSSALNNEKSSSAKERLVDICSLLRCETYINSPGGKGLYDKEYFKSRAVSLKFIETQEYYYKQGSDDFVPQLSIIDVLMWNSKLEVVNLLEKYRLV